MDRIASLPAGTFYGAVVVLAALMAWVQGASLSGDPVRAYAISFACLALALQICGWACVPYVRAARGHLRIRWVLLQTGIVTASLCYTVGALQHFHYIASSTAVVELSVTSVVAESLCLLAATLFFSGASGWMTALDATQALVFTALRFLLTYAPQLRDGFSLNSLEMKLGVALALMAVALMASTGAHTRAERQFLRLLAGYLGVRAVSLFLANQVSYEWLHYPLAGPWDIPSSLAFVFYGAYVARTWRLPHRRVVLKPSKTLRNLMPSTLALGNLALAFFLLPHSTVIAAAAAAVSMLCYVARTVLLQHQNTEERDLLRSRNEHLEAIAERDALTGAGNRLSLASMFARVSSEPGRCVALILVDTDNFKQANDTEGHLYGDKVLIAIARVMQTVTRGLQECHCARFGGDEFAVCLADVSGSEAREIAERIRMGVAKLGFKAGERAVTVSIGATMAVSGPKARLEELISQADASLYRAKSRGRNCVAWAADDVAAASMEAAECMA